MTERMTNFFTGVREAWSLAKPYFTSEEKWVAWGLLILTISLSLLVVGMNVIITYWTNAFFNAIQVYDAKTCIHLLYYPFLIVKGSPFPLMGFAEQTIIFMVIFAAYNYFNQMLTIKWRQWLTAHYVENWLSERAYYTISLRHNPGMVVDNPDQRIAEDLRDFTANTLSLGVDFISNVVQLFSFLFVLYTLSGLIHVFGVTIHGYLVWLAIIYSLVGTVITQLIGRRLIPLSFNQQRLEANFRYRLIRVRENPEAIALARGEGEEHASLNFSFRAVRDNFWSIMSWSVPLNFFTSGFSQMAGWVATFLAAPLYFSKQIGFGGLNQIPMVFGQVQGALSWFVTNYTSLVPWRATVSRLYGFREAMEAARAATAAGPQLAAPGAALTLNDLTLTLPDGRKLLDHANLTLQPGEKVTITGPSGAGKSTLFRAIAGIWPFGDGSVTPPSGTLLFLPQKPYFPIGSLKCSLTYPNAEESFTDECAIAALDAMGLGQLSTRLHETANWGLTLSGGEQQRLALARALVAKPDWLFLDEATSALDAPLAAHVYAQLTRNLPGTTIVAISHHDTPATRHVQLAGGVLASV